MITRRYVEHAIRFIDESVASGKPFYVNLWPDDVHSPFFPPEERRGDGSKKTRYHAVLKTMDEQLGTLFDRLRDLSRASGQHGCAARPATTGRNPARGPVCRCVGRRAASMRAGSAAR